MTDVGDVPGKSLFDLHGFWINLQIGRNVGTPLVVVDDFDIGRTLHGPNETDAPLIVDADRVLSPAVTGPRFRVATWYVYLVLRRPQDRSRVPAERALACESRDPEPPARRSIHSH
jgi:hypothetical protein